MKRSLVHLKKLSRQQCHFGARTLKRSKMKVCSKNCGKIYIPHNPLKRFCWIFKLMFQVSGNNKSALVRIFFARCFKARADAYYAYLNHAHKFHASQQQWTHSLSFSIALIYERRYVMVLHKNVTLYSAARTCIISRSLFSISVVVVVIVNIYLRRFIVTIIAAFRHWCGYLLNCEAFAMAQQCIFSCIENGKYE